MPRCPKDSKYKIGLYRTPARSVAGGGTYLCHIEMVGQLAGQNEKANLIFLSAHVAEAELWQRSCHCGGGAPSSCLSLIVILLGKSKHV